MTQGSKLSLIFNSAKMAIATFLSRILGLVREQVIAGMFGASGLTDAFLVAYRIPNLLRDLLAEGAFSAAFVPSFTEENLEDEAKGNALLWSLFKTMMILTGVLSILIFLFAPQFISLFAPSFKQQPDKFEMAVFMVRVMSPYLVFVSLAALFMGALNSLKIFFIPALAPALLNVVLISSALLFPSLLQDNGMPIIYAIAIGVCIGGFIQMAFQFPFLIRKGYRPKLKDFLGIHPQTKVIFKKLGPGLIGFAAAQVSLIVNTILATGTVVGAVSWLSFAFRLFQFPLGVLGVSIGNSHLVFFAQYWKSGRKEEAIETLRSSLFLSFLLLIPFAFLLFALSEECVNLIYERGKFDRHSTLMTAVAMKFYILGLPFYGIQKIFVPTFYTLDLQRVPVQASLISISFNIIFSVLLVDKYGFSILALSTALSLFINTVYQFWRLGKGLEYPAKKLFSMRYVKVLIAGVFCFWLSDRLAVALYDFDISTSFKIIQLFFCGISGVGIYIFLLTLMGEKEWINFLRKKLNKQ